MRQGQQRADLGTLQNIGPCWTKLLPLPSVLTDLSHAPEPPIHSSPTLTPKICWEVYRSLLNSSLPFGEDWTDPTDRKQAVS